MKRQNRALMLLPVLCLGALGCSDHESTARPDQMSQSPAQGDPAPLSPQTEQNTPPQGLGGAPPTDDCTCGPGLEIDSLGECRDIDECALGLHTCDPVHGDCTNTFGSFGCACKGDTFGDGHFCKTKSDCLPPPCANGGACLETLSNTGFACICPLGTAGSRCEDTQSCALDVPLNQGPTPHITDPVLASTLAHLLGQSPSNVITVGDLTGHYSLTLISAAQPSAVTSLEGLECWTTLHELRLPHQSITDLSPLLDLHFLLELDLTCNPIESTSALRDHVLLQNVSLHDPEQCPGRIAQEVSQSLPTTAFGPPLQLSPPAELCPSSGSPEVRK